MQLIRLGDIKIINTGKKLFVVFKDTVEVFEHTSNILPYHSSSPEIQTPSRALQCQSFITNKELGG